jgi:hypothetical protein
MKWMLSIMAVWWIGIAAIGAAFGFELPKVTPDKGAPYRFGHHYDYDNAGSSWNHERVYRPPGHRHHYSRWYYHYGHKPNPYKKQRSYPYKKYSGTSYEKYGYYPDHRKSRFKAHSFSRPKYTPKRLFPTKFYPIKRSYTKP